MAQNNAPFFILGTQRSGTTLLRLILNSHSDVAIPEEARFLTPLLNKKYANRKMTGTELINVINYLRANEQFKHWNYDETEFFTFLESVNELSLSELISKMYQSYTKSEGKIRWGDKSLFFGAVELFKNFFPEAYYIHIVRDGRDVFSSWRNMDSSKNHPAVMAIDWSYKLHKIEQFFEKLPAGHSMTIRYEDLLSNPLSITQKICKFLDLEFEENMLEFHKTSHKYIGEHHSSLIFNAIDNTNFEKWRNKLSMQEIKSYELFAHRYLKKYGYRFSDDRITPYQMIKAFLDLSVGLPKRIGQIVFAHWSYRRALKRGEATKSIKVGLMPKNESQE